MRKPFLLLICMLITACQAETPQRIRIIVDGQVQYHQTNERIPLLILTQAGYQVAPDDRSLLNGIPVPLDQPLPADITSATLQLRRAVDLILITPGGQQTIRTTASSVGAALQANGVHLYARDILAPPADTPLSSPITVSYIPARELSVFADGKFNTIRSAAGTVGEALAEGGLPLLDLDYSSPPENEALPADGQIRIVRVNESLITNQKSIPYSTEFQESPEIELGQEQTMQAGQNGLTVSRIRIRSEDGQEVSRVTESDTVIRPPRTRIVARGTQIVLNTTVVDGVTIQYWRALQMYATSYSPCRSGVPGQCFNGTAGGLPLKKGVVAMSRDWFNALQGIEVYVPGYGRGVIADLGGGFPDGRPWIDLGYSDSDWQTWSGYVTVYFLAPAPVAIPYIMQ